MDLGDRVSTDEQNLALGRLVTDFQKSRSKLAGIVAELNSAGRDLTSAAELVGDLIRSKGAPAPWEPAIEAIHKLLSSEKLDGLVQDLRNEREQLRFYSEHLRHSGIPVN